MREESESAVGATHSPRNLSQNRQNSGSDRVNYSDQDSSSPDIKPRESGRKTTRRRDRSSSCQSHSSTDSNQRQRQRRSRFRDAKFDPVSDPLRERFSSDDSQDKYRGNYQPQRIWKPKPGKDKLRTGQFPQPNRPENSRRREPAGDTQRGNWDGHRSNYRTPERKKEEPWCHDMFDVLNREHNK